MAFRLVSSAGDTMDAAMFNMYASGTVKNGGVVEFSRTGGAGVYPGSSSSTITNIFGICQDYAQGASDVLVRVIMFGQGQIWEADCVNAALTAQIGLRHKLSDHQYLYNTSTDDSTANGIFRCVAMSSSTTGSGKLLGYFEQMVKGISNNTLFS